jgi:hypothetical protein
LRRVNLGLMRIMRYGTLFAQVGSVGLVHGMGLKHLITHCLRGHCVCCAVCQEGVRAVRRGDDDGWNSFWAGGLAGAALTRLACESPQLISQTPSTAAKC